MKRIFQVLFALVLIAGAFGFWQYTIYRSQPLPVPPETVVLVNPGRSLRQVGTELAERGIVPSLRQFLLWARIYGHDRALKIGEYAIPEKTTLAGLFEILRSGKSISYRVVVPEGSNMFEIAQFLETAKLCPASDFLKLVTDPAFVQATLGEPVTSLEGYLFPDTYLFTRVDTVKIMAGEMVRRFKERFKEVPPRQGWSRHQIVTLGSIIEKETGAPFERRTISSVFHNRLNQKMRLQTDPTVLYGKLLKTRTLQTNITKADLLEDNIYNTYTRAGLPAGPISNPGVEALKAAVDPEPTEYLFFVSKNDGTHIFNKTYAAHASSVGVFQLDPKARANKSWRDLKKGPQPASKPEAKPTAKTPPPAPRKKAR